MKQLILSISLLAGLLSSNLSAENYAVMGGKIHTVSEQGIIEGGTVLLKGGKIEAVLEEEVLPAGYTPIDATGKVVTPGLFPAFTALGLEEVSLSAGTVDKSVKETAVSHTGAALEAHYGINPDSSLMNINRIEGITSVASGITRSEQMFSGQGAIVTLGSKTSPILQSNAFMHIDVSNRGVDKVGGSRAALWTSLQQAIKEASFAAQKAFSPLSGPSSWHGMSTMADAKALNKVIKGEMPLLFTALRASDIRNVILLKQEYPKLKPVIVGGTEAWRVAAQLAEAEVPVIIEPESNLPYSFEQLGATLQNAARLEAAGVLFAISATDTHNIRLVTQHVGNAVSHGLSYDAGLAALSINAAEIFGVEDKLGSLEVGKQADLVVWSGDPLEVTESAEYVFIQGEMIPRVSRQTKLRDRYLNLAKDKTMPYVRP